MGEKNGKNHDGGEKTKPKPKDKAGEDGALKVVLKVDMHCQGCAKKVKRSVFGFQGVESVETDNESSMLTVVGKVDPWKLRERVELKTHKKVTLISPMDYPKEKKVGKQENSDMKKKKKNSDEPKPPVASTVVLNILLHCEGCIQRIRRSIYKIKGVEQVSFDAPKDLVTVIGIMDVKSMVSFLQNKFKRRIAIIQAAGKKDDPASGGDKKKDKAKEDDKGKGKAKDKAKEGGDDDKKDKVNSDEKKKKKKNDRDTNGGDDKKEKKGVDGGGGEKKEKKEKKDGGGDGGEKKEKKDGGGEGKMEASKMEYYSGGYVPYEQHYYYQQQQYQQYQQYEFPQQQYQQPQQQYHPAMDVAHAPQMFSDENPNACWIM